MSDVIEIHTVNQTIVVETTKTSTVGIVTEGPQGIQGPPGEDGASTWEEIDDKPTEFPPEAHTHPTSDVTGLDSALLSKAQTLKNGDTLVSGGVYWLASATAVTITTAAIVSDVTDMVFINMGPAVVTINTLALSPYTVYRLSVVGGGWSIAAINGLVRSVNSKTPLNGNVQLSKADLSLGNVDNTSDANKPISTATQTALNLKAPLASPTFTGTPTGITKTHVGLGNVDNTSDANKPVSTAQASAIAAKASLEEVWLTSPY